MKDKALEALIRKATNQAAAEKAKRDRFVDPTLQATRRPEGEATRDTTEMFKEMKKREF